MSASQSPLGSDELRRRFAVWTLAIVSTLSGSGSVQLVSPVWAADPPAGLPPDKTNDAAVDKQEKVADPAAQPPLTRQVVQEILAQRDFQRAQQLVSSTLEQEPTDEQLYLCYMLTNALSRENQADASQLLHQLLEKASQRLNADSSNQLISVYVLGSQGLSSQLARDNKVDEAIEVLQGAIERMSVVRKDSPMASTIPTMLAQLCIEHKRIDVARAQLEQQVNQAKAALDASPSPSARRAWAVAVSNFVRLLGEALPVEVDTLSEQACNELAKAVESEEAVAEDYQAYQSLQLAIAARLDGIDPQRSLEVLNATKEIGNKLADRLDEADAKQLRASMTTLDAAVRRTNSKVVHAQLIGSPAPELPIEAVVNMPRVTMQELKGKVVLIDFWAVWCGPCIATFPHLRHLHETYSDKGLVIVGLTRQYGYVWDGDAGKQVADKTATLEQELEMLEQFRLKYELPYGFIVTPRESEIQNQYGVYGIPQAVVIDREGKVQLIVTGSGQANATKVEEKIESLIGAKEPS